MHIPEGEHSLEQMVVCDKEEGRLVGVGANQHGLFGTLLLMAENDFRTRCSSR